VVPVMLYIVLHST